MQVDEDDDMSVCNRHVTPYNSASGKFSYRMENSTDSGFFSNTPSSESIFHNSRDLSCSSDQSNSRIESTSKGSSSYYQTRVAGRLKEMICSPLDHSTFNESDFPSEISPTTRIDNSHVSASIDSVLGDASLYYDASEFQTNNSSCSIRDGFMKETDSCSDDSFEIIQQPVCEQRIQNNKKEHIELGEDCLDCEMDEVFVVNGKTMYDSEYPKTVISPRKNRKTTTISNVSLSPAKRKSSWPKALFQPKRYFLDGSEFVDFLYLLGQYTTVTSKLFSYLTDDDLESVSKVSKTWKQVLQNDLKTKKRLSAHIRNVMNTKENKSAFKIHKMRDFRKQGLEWAQSPFSNIQNIQINSSPTKIRTQSTTSSPETFRFNLFKKEAEKLDRAGKLMRCPRCTLPARCNEAKCSNLGECVTPSCLYKFCTNCRAEFHSPRKCIRISSCPIKRKNMIIGSKASKRRLSRT